MTMLWSYRNDRIIKRAVVYLLLAGLTIAIFLPILLTITISFRPNREVLVIPPRWIPRTFTLRAYQEVLARRQNLVAFANSVFVSLSVTMVTLVLATLAGYGYSRYAFRGKRKTRYFIIITQMLPPIFILVPYYMLFTRLGMYDTYLSLIFAYTSFSLPFSILMVSSFFESIPIQLDESAMIDGCSRIGALLRIIVPVSKHALLATGAFCFINAWTELLFAVVLTRSPSMRMFTTAVVAYIGEFTRNWSSIAAISILGTIPLVVIWIFLQRHIIEGMTAGSVKG